jgi:DNA-binding LytR/AlgR family response regulator
LRILEATQEVRVVFSDVEMPGSLNGLGLARRICQRWSSIGTVPTSGHRTREVIPRDGRFLPKPYAGRALVRQIEEMVNQQTMSRKATSRTPPPIPRARPRPGLYAARDSELISIEKRYFTSLRSIRS